MKTQMFGADQFIEETWNEVDLNCGNTDKIEMWLSQLYLEFKQLQILGPKKFSGNGIRIEGLCIALKCSTNWVYEDPYVGSRPIYRVHFYPWQEWDMKWNWFELREMDTDEMVMWASQLFLQFRQLQILAGKNFRPSQKNFSAVSFL